jgi:hypothetical protein
LSNELKNFTGSLSLERFNVGAAADKSGEDIVSMVSAEHKGK